ncbi:hypothetical protein B0H16DRAFT_1749698 [Mycena metata]|uniref:Uncharacterized protein n=1 Tax=Mycena metata TaxID=1033252 RepID=A0AAD7DUR3_9AGAR|nr:hypothetical protein B0H16DRAFT_1749698 [Mycena metata]
MQARAVMLRRVQIIIGAKIPTLICVLLAYVFPVKDGKRKLLDSVSGVVVPGKLTALMEDDPAQILELKFATAHARMDAGWALPSPSLSFLALGPHVLIPLVPHALVPLGSPAIASPLHTRAVESNTLWGCIYRMHALRAALVPSPLPSLSPSLPPPCYPPVPRPRVECNSHSVTLQRMRTRMSVCVRVESPRSSPSPFSPPVPLFLPHLHAPSSRVQTAPNSTR